MVKDWINARANEMHIFYKTKCSLTLPHAS
jgi:hypothetical protein